jgi:sigma-B regulation protein RsbU (phosphoserine phosphatase)
VGDLSDLYEIEDITTEEPPAKEPNSNKLVLYQVELPQASGELVGKIASSTWYVYSTASVLELSDDLADGSINAVGVVDESGSVVGIVTRQELFGSLSRPYGREVMNQSPVGSVAARCRTFPTAENVFAVAESISPELAQDTVSYFILTKPDGSFGGIFTTMDMLLYLSNITQQDIDLAQRIQRRIVKEYTRIDEPSLQLLCSSSMAKGIGGDFYAVKKIQDTRWFFSLCDVSGKGVAASLITSVLSGLINNYELQRGITRFVSDINSMFVQQFQREKFVTGVFCDFNSDTGELVFCDMAHSFIYLYRNGSLLQLRSDAENIPIGVQENITPVAARATLAPGDVLMIFTDGVLEQTNLHGEVFELDAITDQLTDVSAEKFERAFLRVMEIFHHFRGAAPLHDDVTFLLMHYK